VARVAGRSVARALNWRVSTVAHCTLPACPLAHGRGWGATRPQVSPSAPAQLVVCAGQPAHAPLADSYMGGSYEFPPGSEPRGRIFSYRLQTAARGPTSLTSENGLDWSTTRCQGVTARRRVGTNFQRRENQTWNRRSVPPPLTAGIVLLHVSSTLDAALDGGSFDRVHYLIEECTDFCVRVRASGAASAGAFVFVGTVRG
jgi:hypothetical protein